MPASERQRSIMAAALSIVESEGVEHLTVRNIGKRLSISDAALYKHFDSKREILAGIVEQFRDDSLSALNRIAAHSGNCLEKIERFFLDRAEYFAAHPDMVPMMFPESMIAGHQVLFKSVLRAMDDHKKLIVGYIEEAQKKGDIPPANAEHLFIIIMGAFRLMLTRWRYSGHGFDLEKEARSLWASLAALMTTAQK